MLKANKGEWSELYTFLKIISEKEIAAADENLRPLVGQSYTFLKLFRKDHLGKKLEYNLETPGEVTIYNSEYRNLKTIKTDELSTKTKKILQSILLANSASFEVPFAEATMTEYLIEKIKAGSSEKADLVGVILDRISSEKPELGFSIKSQLGGASTLLNASSQTNFIYDVLNYRGSLDEVNDLAGSSKLRDRLQMIYNSGATIEFKSVSSSVFDSNLRFIDSSFSKVISEMLIAYYLGQGKYIPELCEVVGTKGVAEMNGQEVAYKVKSFLRAVALGMVPSRLWDTYLSTYGGYIVVRQDGELVCYHLYNDDRFKDYLFRNTRLETPSSSRHGFGKLYFDESGQLKIKLNLQIRFTI